MEKAVIITAPSGAGKSTIANYLLEAIEELEFSVSATTRPIREEEEEGVDYYFISKEDFGKRIEGDEFVEWEEVYQGIFYGTLKSEVERIWKMGKSVLFVVDVIGARDLKTYFGNNGLSLFIAPPSLEVLKARLESRGSETAADMKKRMDRVQLEMGMKDEFDSIILNDDLGEAKAHAEAEVRYFLRYGLN